MFGVVLSLCVNYICLVYHRKAAEIRAADASAYHAAVQAPAASGGEGDTTATAEDSDDRKAWAAEFEVAEERLQEHVFEGQGLYYRFRFNIGGQRLVLSLVGLAAVRISMCPCPCWQLQAIHVHGVMHETLLSRRC